MKSNTHDQWDYTTNSPTLSNFNQSNTTAYLTEHLVSDLSYDQKNNLNRSYFPITSTNLSYSPKQTYSNGFGFSVPPSSVHTYDEHNINNNSRKRKLRDIANIPLSSRFHFNRLTLFYTLQLNIFVKRKLNIHFNIAKNNLHKSEYQYVTERNGYFYFCKLYQLK